MLAQPIEELDEIYEDIQSYAFEYKLDGVRIQVHKGGWGEPGKSNLFQK